MRDRYQDALPSSLPDAYFTVDVRITVDTYLAEGLDPVADAVLKLEQILRKAVSHMSVLRRDVAQRALNSLVAQSIPLALDDDATLSGVIAVLAVEEDSLNFAREFEALRREAHLDEMGRRQMRAAMNFVRDECLVDPASARLFLMLNHSSRLGSFPSAERADDLIEELSLWRPDQGWIRLAKAIQDIVKKLSPSQIDEIVMLLQTVLKAGGHHQVAASLESFRSGDSSPS
jgi:hypothetical protein